MITNSLSEFLSRPKPMFSNIDSSHIFKKIHFYEVFRFEKEQYITGVVKTSDMNLNYFMTVNNKILPMGRIYLQSYIATICRD